MDTRKLGAAGPEVSTVGLGCMGLTGGYRPTTREEAVRIVHRALDLGITAFDTADFYAGGANEELLGRALARRREQAVIITRGGVRSRVPGGPPSVLDGRRVYLRQACEASLRRLNVTHIDVYCLGRVDPAVPVEESVGALVDLLAEGKIGHIALSEVSADTLRRAARVHPIAAVESEYSLWERHVEDEILPTARELGVSLLAHSPLGKGFLAGALRDPNGLGDRDHRRNHPRLQGDNFRTNRRPLQEAAALADQLGMSQAQLALSWLLTRDNSVTPIPGSTRVAQLDDNAAAADRRLPANYMRALDEIFRRGRVVGSRHPAHRARAGADRDG
ncbi:aldo/keto reductase [Kitasatospora sp. NPDC089509]|uniref:aldo/keto reductase n=1 Tax=Kitasatospora sp. NPDC089509 TaxID=3364079 RepID=UPI00380E79C4